MASGGDKEFALAKVYAAAMLTLGKPSGQEAALGDELREFSALVDADAKFARFLLSPTVETAARQRTIEKVFRGKLSDVCVDSLQVLSRNERNGLIGAVSRAYDALLQESQNRLSVRVKSATPLNDSQRDRLRATLSKTTGRQVDLVEAVEEGVGGGLVVQLGDDRYDSSVAGKLRTLGERLGERASRELLSGKKYSVGMP